ncbi:MAG: nucleotide exchange factor GrpE [Bacteroidetes bacterium]|nr:MAG: nucleotide exchange factor GrpE [Bacteroidota bacterium]
MSEETKEQDEQAKNTADESTQDTEKETVEVKEPSAEEKLSELNDKYLRLYSEFDNYRKRTSKERIELFKTAGQDIMTDLIPVMDDFERALQNMDKKGDVKTIRQGVDLVYNKFKTSLEAKGLKAFKSIEKEFDPEIHEAITKIPAPSKKLKGKVVDEIEKGYKLNDKVIRFAKVVVGE